MKKAASLILATVLMFTFFVPSFAASKKCSCGKTPVVYIPGFGDPIYTDLDSEEPVSVFPPESDAILEAVPDLLTAVGGLLVGSNEAFGTYVMKGADKMLDGLACNADGTAPENTGADDDHALVYDAHKSEEFDISNSSIDGAFRFGYDWRISPLENAEMLKEYIDAVKKFTGHNKVVLLGHSQGNTIIASYLHLYGSKGIEKIVSLSPAYQGISLIGSLFKKEVSVSHKGEALEEYLRGIMGFEDAQSQLIVSAVSLLNKYGMVDGLLNYLQGVLDEQLDRVFDECLIDILGTMPGVWSFVPDEDYEDAKEAMFGGKEKEYAELIEKIDDYHYNVQNQLVKILKKAKTNGTAIVISAGYDISTIPVSYSDATHSDFLIDTKYTTIGATCSDITETLGKDYKQAVKCGHNHVSPENTIDASTCAFPEYTWFFSGLGHSDWDNSYVEFIEWAIRYKGQPTVRSSKQYQQFSVITDDGIIPAKAQKTVVETRSDEEIIVTSLVTLVKDSISG